MDMNYIIAYAIINRVCQSKSFPMHHIMYTNLFGRRGFNTVMSQIKSIAVHNIRLKTGLTHKQIGQLLTFRDHSTSIYFCNLYDDLYKMDKRFRVLADSALA